MAGIYIHIPFCKKACYYCDFHFSTSLKNKSRLIKALINEIKLRSTFFSKSDNIETLYFGGGTPSLLSLDELNDIFEALYKYFNLSGLKEITLEINPDDINNFKLKELLSTPINRLSIGVQSFYDEDLKWMNRIHSAEQSIKSIKQAQQKGFSNITIDLIYGLPQLTNKKWEQNLTTAFNLNINHLSAYCLTIEPKTVFGNWFSKNKIIAVDEDKSAQQFEILLNKANDYSFSQYEISNFAKNNFLSIHNSNYWLDKKYLGLGPSAHSYNHIIRSWNVSNNSTYIYSLEKDNLVYDQEQVTPTNRYNEYVLTSLRTSWGLSLNYVLKTFGNKLFEYCLLKAKKFVDTNYIKNNNNKLYLTTKGKLLADKISSEMFC